jgi:hypothetical protein
MEISKSRNYSEKPALSKEFNLPEIGNKNGISESAVRLNWANRMFSESLSRSELMPNNQ